MEMSSGQCASMSSDLDTDCQGLKPGLLYHCMTAVCESRRVLGVYIVHVYYTHDLIIRSTSWTVWIDCMHFLTVDRICAAWTNKSWNACTLAGSCILIRMHFDTHTRSLNGASSQSQRVSACCARYCAHVAAHTR